MPAITSGRVLLTGANGYIAVWVLKYLLERSFSVRATVRSDAKAAFLLDLFGSYRGQLELVVVEDITQEGAFDNAMLGVDAVLHIASPVNLSADEPDEVIIPAVQGTLGIMKSALKYRSSIKRVVLTSSCGAVALAAEYTHDDIRRIYDEADWADSAVENVRELGKEAHPWDKYRASKVLAERAAWELYEREKHGGGGGGGDGGLEWDLVALVPPRVYGPAIHEVSSPENMTWSAREWYDNVVREKVQGDALVKHGYDYVDVRDFAHAEILALITPTAGGERLIVRGGSFTWQEFVNAARHYSDIVAPGDESYDPTKAQYPVRYSSEKACRMLGIRYRTLEETAQGCIEDYKGRGWL